MSDPLNLTVIDEIEFTTGCKVRPVLATISAINSAVRKYYRGQNTVIRPLSLVRDNRTGDTGRMQLVRRGGNVETVDTATRPEEIASAKAPAPTAAESEPETSEEPGDTQEKVSEIKARRARQVAKQRSDKKISADEAMQDYLSEVQIAELENLHKLEKYFWALMRVMAKKGVVTKEEFLRELKE
jgi:hypothetical protein